MEKRLLVNEMVLDMLPLAGIKNGKEITGRKYYISNRPSNIDYELEIFAYKDFTNDRPSCEVKVKSENKDVLQKLLEKIRNIYEYIKIGAK